MFEYLWNYFMLSVDIAPESIGDSFPTSILWTSIVVAFFYAFHMILINIISTDLMVLTIKPTIETLADLLYDESFNVSPMIIRNLNMYNVLNNAENGTDERLLFDRLVNNETGKIIVSETETTFIVFQFVLEQVKNGYAALIENSRYFTMSSYSLCSMYPHIMDGIQSSSEIILPSALSLLVSKNTPEAAIEIFKHRVLSASEMDVLEGTAIIYSSALSYLGYSSNSSIDSMICEEKISKTYRNELDLSWEPLSLESYQKLFKICYIVFFIAFVSLLYEILLHTSKYLIRRDRARTKGRRKQKIT